MKIIRLSAENVKRLVAVEIEPTGNLVEITGKNGAGKTSVYSIRSGGRSPAPGPTKIVRSVTERRRLGSKSTWVSSSSGGSSRKLSTAA